MKDYIYPKYQNRPADPYKRKGKAKITALFKDPILKIYSKHFKKFTLDGTTYSNFYNYYNTTWRNERAVEVPVIKKLLDRYQGKDVFEFGDVIKHYFNLNHDVLDKYETYHGAINEDIIYYRTPKKYDFVFSISTVEHVGRDEKPKDPPKALKAIKTMQNMLKPGGLMVITFPFGYNDYLDTLIRKGKFPFNQLLFLKRISQDNRWVEANYKDVKSCKYGSPYQNGNGMIFAFYTKGDNKFFKPR